MGGRGKGLNNQPIKDNYFLELTHNRTDSAYHNRLAKAARIIAKEYGIDKALDITFLDDGKTDGWVPMVKADDGWVMNDFIVNIVTPPGEDDFNYHRMVIAHELKHIQQAREGRFKVVTSTKLGNELGVYFNGKKTISLEEYDDISDKLLSKDINIYADAVDKYQEWSWEKEAYTAEDKWYKYPKGIKKA